MNKGLFNRNRKIKYTKKNKLNRNTKKNRKSLSLQHKSKKNVQKDGGYKKKTSKKSDLHIFQSKKKRDQERKKDRDKKQKSLFLFDNEDSSSSEPYTFREKKGDEKVKQAVVPKKEPDFRKLFGLDDSDGSLFKSNSKDVKFKRDSRESQKERKMKDLFGSDSLSSDFMNPRKKSQKSSRKSSQKSSQKSKVC